MPRSVDAEIVAQFSKLCGCAPRQTALARLERESLLKAWNYYRVNVP